MTWIKVEDLMPPTHEIILFQDRWRNEHYGVLCGEHAPIKERNKFWCHIFQILYAPKDILYWTGIPINKHYLLKDSEFSGKVNDFLWNTIEQIERSVLNDFERQKKEYPEWEAAQFVEVAVRNTAWRIMDILKVTKNES